MTSATIPVTLRYFAALREQRGLETETFDTDAPTPLALYETLAMQHRFTLSPGQIRVAVNDRFCAMDVMLQPGDRIVFVPPVAGG